MSKKECGQSLVSMMVGMGVMAVIMLGFASMMSSQQKETRALAEKLAALDFTRMVTSILANVASCDAIFNPANVSGAPGSLTFNSTLYGVGNPYVINLAAIGGIGGGQAVSPLSRSLLVKAVNGLQLRVTSPTTADLVIDFEQANLVRPVKPLSFGLRLQSSGPPNAALILGCAAGVSGSCPNGQLMRGINADGTLDCTTDLVVGGICSHGSGKGVVMKNTDGHRCCAVGTLDGGGVNAGYPVCYEF